MRLLKSKSSLAAQVSIKDIQKKIDNDQGADDGLKGARTKAVRSAGSIRIHALRDAV
jgi:hypothetical protein